MIRHCTDPDRISASHTAAVQSEEMATEAVFEEIRERAAGNPDRFVSELRRLGLY